MRKRERGGERERRREREGEKKVRKGLIERKDCKKNISSDN